MPEGATHLAKMAISPRYRRWRRLLESSTLELDPPGGHDVVESPDFLICGLPRSGTALLTAALFQPPAVITTMEPWDAFRLTPAALIASLRNELEADGVLARGRLDVAALGEGRVAWCRDGEKPVDVEYGRRTAIAVKVPGYWQLLGRLGATRFIVCLRDPVEVATSFANSSGRLAVGLEYDVAFYRGLNQKLEEATTDPALRRVLLLEQIAQGIKPHIGRPEVLVVRYERWFRDPEALMAEVAEFIGIDVEPSSVRIRPASSSSHDDHLRALIRRYAPTACALGYDV